jgi:hypothetical protein
LIRKLAGGWMIRQIEEGGLRLETKRGRLAASPMQRIRLEERVRKKREPTGIYERSRQPEQV